MPLPAEVRRPFMLATSLWNGSGGRPRRGLRAGVPGVYRGGGLPERELHHIAAPTTRLGPPSRPGTARAPLRRDLSPGTGGCKLLPVARALAVASGAPVAQRIEHLTTDQKVVGSNPIGRTSCRTPHPPGCGVLLIHRRASVSGSAPGSRYRRVPSHDPRSSSRPGRRGARAGPHGVRGSHRFGGTLPVRLRDHERCGPDDDARRAVTVPHPGHGRRDVPRGGVVPAGRH